MILTITHVVIDGAPPDSAWAVFAAIAAAGAAIATAILAFITRNLAVSTDEMAQKTRELAEQTAMQAKESASAIEQAERHHREDLAPLVFVNADCNLATTGTGKYSIIFKGKLENVGHGPSSGVNIYVHPEGLLGRWFYVGLIGPTAFREFSVEWVVFGIIPLTPQMPYKCLTRFATVFGTEGAVAQSSHSGYSGDAVVIENIAPSADRTALRELLSELFSAELPAN